MEILNVFIKINEKEFMAVTIRNDVWNRLMFAKNKILFAHHSLVYYKHLTTQRFLCIPSTLPNPHRWFTSKWFDGLLHMLRFIDNTSHTNNKIILSHQVHILVSCFGHGKIIFSPSFQHLNISHFFPLSTKIKQHLEPLQDSIFGPWKM